MCLKWWHHNSDSIHCMWCLVFFERFSSLVTMAFVGLNSASCQLLSSGKADPLPHGTHINIEGSFDQLCLILVPVFYQSLPWRYGQGKVVRSSSLSALIVESLSGQIAWGKCFFYNKDVKGRWKQLSLHCVSSVWLLHSEHQSCWPWTFHVDCFAVWTIHGVFIVEL